MYSIAFASLHANENIQIIFLNINRTISDIFCQKELDELAQKFKKNFKLFNCLSHHDDESDGKWDGLKGKINHDLLKKCGFPSAADDIFIAYSGPYSMFGPIRQIF